MPHLTNDEWEILSLRRETFPTRDEWGKCDLHLQWAQVGSLGVLTIRWGEEMALYDHVGRDRLAYGVEYEEGSRASAEAEGESNATDTSPIASSKGKGAGTRESRRRFLQDPTYQTATAGRR